MKKIAALLLTLNLLGCGTLESVSRRGPPFGGIIYDSVGFVRAFPLVPFMMFYLVDLPFSAVADTLIFPFVIIDLATYGETQNSK